MTDFGLGKKGFKRKRYDDVIESMNARAKSLFGEDINLSEKSPIGLFFRIISWSVAILWQLAEKVYFSAYVDTAEGISLARVGKYIGITPKLGEKASMKPDKSPADVLIEGDPGAEITTDLIVSTEGNVWYRVIEATTINESGIARAKIRAEQSGIIGNVPANTITQIITPLTGVTSVINTEAVIGGRNEEKESEFRERYAMSVAKGGASTLDSIRASLLEINGVRAALVVENNTMTIDEDGRPAKSIECYLLGGNSEEVAKKILSTKAAGIESYGTQTVFINDNAGNPQIIKFTSANEIDIYINVTITKNNEYPIDGDELVRTELIKHIGGTDEDSNVYTGLGMGDNVVFTKLIKMIYKVPGVDDLELEIGIDGITYDVSNIAIAQAEVAETDYTKVVVISA